MTALVRFLFNHRRKTIGTLLKKWPEGWTDRQTLLESLEDLGLEARLRPENLSPQDYVNWWTRIQGAT